MASRTTSFEEVAGFLEQALPDGAAERALERDPLGKVAVTGECVALLGIQRAHVFVQVASLWFVRVARWLGRARASTNCRSSSSLPALSSSNWSPVPSPGPSRFTQTTSARIETSRYSPGERWRARSSTAPLQADETRDEGASLTQVRLEVALNAAQRLVLQGD